MGFTLIPFHIESPEVEVALLSGVEVLSLCHCEVGHVDIDYLKHWK